jgi:hypothetical protein
MTDRDDEERRLASGFGARPPRPSKEPGADRAVTGQPVGAGPAGGRDDARGDDGDTVDETEEENFAQADPLSGNPPT